MRKPTIQDILSTIEQPSRYLGTETNVIRKDFSQVELRVALAFPDLYDIGTSHFGMQILYHMLNQRSDTLAERVFAPGIDMQATLKASGIPLASLESGRALGDFDIIGFSLLYELNYTNILSMLDLAQIAFLADQRNEKDPLIIAGGPCTCNPEPVADFFDAMVIGDGEMVMIEMVDFWMAWRKGRRPQKSDLLEQWAHIEGVYIPSFFKPVYDPSGMQSLQPVSEKYTRVKRAIVRDLDQSAFPDSPIVPFGRPVHDRLRLEVARGCTRGCRFCQAGMIYRPVRERSPVNLLSLAERSLKQTGYEDLSLLSLSTGDYGCIDILMQELMDRCSTDHVAVSLPSLRAGTLTPELMSLIKRVRKTGFTIAPEAGSQRLRNVINKNIDEREIVETVENAFALGWQVIKLYFMIGLPTETDEDLDAIVELVQQLRRVKKPAGRKGRINVSVATFIPKPHTPFQWVGQNSLAVARQKVQRLHDRLRVPGIHFKWQPPEVSQIEGLWARGDRRLSRLLVKAFESGCRFDGWSDHFDHALWQKACHAQGVSIESINEHQRDLSEPLPWDHIDTGVSKEFLQNEYRRALSGKLSEDCRLGACHQCGVCDFKKIAPVLFSRCDVDLVDKTLPSGNRTRQMTNQKLLITFSKTGPARFLGHLEMANVFIRAFRRSGIRLKFSEGYHPKPQMAFFDALPVGMESFQEYLVVTTSGEVAADKLVSRLNSSLPKGLNIRDCCGMINGKRQPGTLISKYRVVSDADHFNEKLFEAGLKKTEWNIERKNRKGKIRRINLRSAVHALEWVSTSEMQLTLLSSPGLVVRPAEIAAYLFGLSSDDLKRLRTSKMASRIERAEESEETQPDSP